MNFPQFELVSFEGVHWVEIACQLRQQFLFSVLLVYQWFFLMTIFRFHLFFIYCWFSRFDSCGYYVGMYVYMLFFVIVVLMFFKS